MRIEGTHDIAASRTDVWSALHDPDVLVNTLPGLRELRETGDGQYAMSIEFGVGSIRGLYEGSFGLSDGNPEESCTVIADASGSPGVVDAVAEVRLEDLSDGQTRLSYTANANVAGPVAGVGQRLVGATAKRTTTQFVAGLERQLSKSGNGEFPDQPAASATNGDGQRVFSPGPRSPKGIMHRDGFVAGLLLGFGLAIVGVAVGRWTGRSHG